MNKLIFKRIDFWIQITAFLSFTLFIVINSFEKSAQFYYPSLELILPYLVSYFFIIIIQFFQFFSIFWNSKSSQNLGQSGKLYFLFYHFCQ